MSAQINRSRFRFGLIAMFIITGLAAIAFWAARSFVDTRPIEVIVRDEILESVSNRGPKPTVFSEFDTWEIEYRRNGNCHVRGTCFCYTPLGEYRECTFGVLLIDRKPKAVYIGH